MRIALVGALIVVLPVLPAQAGWLGTGGASLPKPVKFTDRMPREAHKMGAHVRNLGSKYNSPTWGNVMRVAAKQETRDFTSYLR